MAPDLQKSSADAKIDAALAAASAAAPMAQLNIGLSNGRQAVVEFPIPLSPEDALRIQGAFVVAYLNQFDAEAAQAKSGLVVPGRSI